MSDERPVSPGRRYITTVIASALALWAMVTLAIWATLDKLHTGLITITGAIIGAFAAGALLMFAGDRWTGRRQTAPAARTDVRVGDGDTLPLGLIRSAPVTYMSAGSSTQQMESRICAVERAVADLTTRVDRRSDADYVDGAMAALDKVNGWPSNVRRLH